MTVPTTTETSRRLTFAYYCSGHGYGHATRVSAFARHLLSLDDRPLVHIVSSAPKHVFSDSIAQGALYRNANIDPVIVQPLAYRVDRQKSVEVLENFMERKDQKVLDESQWLKAVGADCVLSDAAFLGCLAANEAGIPSVLITNFTFDSVYSYLSTPLIDEPSKPEHPAADALLSPPAAKAKEDLEPDVPIPLQHLAPLVDQINTGYRCADLLMRLPGMIPLPSFAIRPGLPSPNWVDIDARTFKQPIIDHLAQSPSSYALHPQIPFPPQYPPKPLGRTVASAPLLVRAPNPDIYTLEGRSRFLTSIGVPAHLHDPATTRILIVSFGGQVFHKPHSRSHSRTPSKAATPLPQLSPTGTTVPQPPPREFEPSPARHGAPEKPPAPEPEPDTRLDPQALKDALRAATSTAPAARQGQQKVQAQTGLSRSNSTTRALAPLRLHGAPPAAVPTSPRTATASTFSAFPAFEAVTIPPSPAPGAPCAFGGASAGPGDTEASGEGTEDGAEDEPRILPDASWIAVVCGVSKDWGREDGEALPEGFFVAPRDVYMPDLTAVADVLLGKLGYGTVSECVDACTPFVYVPRPLFIEEHGLRLLLEREGAGVELSRTQYEVGEWADAVARAWALGRAAKAAKRAAGETGARAREGREMARRVVDWVARWQAAAAEAGKENARAVREGVVAKDGALLAAKGDVAARAENAAGGLGVELNALNLAGA